MKNFLFSLRKKSNYTRFFLILFLCCFCLSCSKLKDISEKIDISSIIENESEVTITETKTVPAIANNENIANGVEKERVFLNLSLELLDQTELPDQNFQDTKVGGLSAITYDRQKNLFYAVSDDRSRSAPARFYTLKLNLNQNDPQKAKIDKIEIEDVTLLKNEQGENYPKNAIDPEGIALSPRNTIFISSEGSINENVNPFIGEFDFDGNLIKQVRIPKRYLPNEESEESPQGIRSNLGFEALTIKANGTVKEDPFRLFVATEAALSQDVDPENPQTKNNSRFLHYVINPFGQAILVGEHIYTLDKTPFGVVRNGLTELIALPKEGYLLSLERTAGISGIGAKVFQVVIADATDTSVIKALDFNTENYKPLKKKLMLDLQTLDIPLDNLEGMTLGPILEDGSQSLILISDNNFSSQQQNQFLLFKLAKK